MSLVSYDNFVHAISGACGSVTAMAVTLPFDTARTRILLDNTKTIGSKGTVAYIFQLAQEEGATALYRGAKATLQAVAISNFVYFYTFHGLKHLAGVQNVKQSAAKDLLFACMAGSVNVCLTNPFWVVSTRMKVQRKRQSPANEHDEDEDIGGSRRQKLNGLFDGLCKIARTEGVGGLWSGTVPSLVLVSNPAIKFTAYEYLKRKLLEWRLELGAAGDAAALDAGQAFFLGVMASAVATVVTYPIQVVQTKSRHGHGFKDLKKNASMVELFFYLVRNFGTGYLYKGLDGKLIQTVITAGFMFLTYEKLSAFIFSLFGLQKKLN